ncbi:hypothetical protein A6C57_26140 [Fibrella sp. ES10-3-2-2]
MTFCQPVTNLSPGTLQTNQNALSNGDSPVDRNEKHLQKNAHYQLDTLSHETRNAH